MFEVILTFTKVKATEVGGSVSTYSVTDVYRLQFDTEEAFRTWKDSADCVIVERLTV